MLLIYSNNITPRLTYIFKFILETICGLEYKLTSDAEYMEKHTGPKFWYTKQKEAPLPYLSCHEILFQNNLLNQYKNIEIINKKDHTAYFFEVPKTCFFHFDIFAASFFLLSRYEEYLTKEKDPYGRFPAEASFAFKHNFLKIPIIDSWAYDFLQKLKQIYPSLQNRERKFQFLPTIDVDNAYAYKYKGIKRIIGASLRSLGKGNFADFFQRFQVLANIKPDPYFTFEEIEKLHSKWRLKPIFFFLIADYGKFDKNISPKKTALQDLIKSLKKKYPIGIHPGFASNKKIETLKKEINRLKTITGERPFKSRQHFLMLNLPKTYKSLEQSGIKEDYTMAYASHPGFRAGTCTPFPFFNLTENKELAIKVYPLAIMETTLIQYMKKSPGEALEVCKKIVDAIKKVNGLFVSLWHNESFSKTFSKGEWLHVYNKLIEYSISSNSGKS